MPTQDKPAPDAEPAPAVVSKLLGFDPWEATFHNALVGSAVVVAQQGLDVERVIAAAGAIATRAAEVIAARAPKAAAEPTDPPPPPGPKL